MYSCYMYMYERTLFDTLDDNIFSNFMCIILKLAVNTACDYLVAFPTYIFILTIACLIFAWLVSLCKSKKQLIPIYFSSIIII